MEKGQLNVEIFDRNLLTINNLAVEGFIVFISNLHDETTEADINDKFSKYGTIMNMQMPLDRRSGYVKVSVL
jgi:RNA recognition motif-containing protein